MSNQTVQFKDFVFLSLDPLKVAGWSTNKYNQVIFSKLFDMVCLALNYLFVKKIEKAWAHLALRIRVFWYRSLSRTPLLQKIKIVTIRFSGYKSWCAIVYIVLTCCVWIWRRLNYKSYCFVSPYPFYIFSKTYVINI